MERTGKLTPTFILIVGLVPPYRDNNWALWDLERQVSNSVMASVEVAWMVFRRERLLR